MTSYQDFLASKVKISIEGGINISVDELNPSLMPFQKSCVQWALRKQSAAFFWDCGLGKTLAQLEWASQLCERGIIQRCLILAPAVVPDQTKAEADKFHISAPIKVCRDQSQVIDGINLTNYERRHLFDIESFDAIVLDESSILKSYMGVTKRELVERCKGIPWRLCCTATPSPNDLLELGNHAEFLGIMPSNEMIARWFINNTMKAGDYKLKQHGEKDFWKWVASWATCIGKPSDIGFEDEGFELPPLEFINHYLDIDIPPPPGMLFDIGKVNATTIHAQRRFTLKDRAKVVADLVNSDGNIPWTVWCDTNYEADALKPVILNSTEIRGSDSAENKETKLRNFSSGAVQSIIAKPSQCGFGLNWQHCHKMAFVGLNYSFEQWYQAIRRQWRFGQTQPVEVHLVHTQADDSITAILWSKDEIYKHMRNSMVDAMREAQMEEIHGKKLELTDAPEPSFKDGENWRLWRGDCVETIKRLEDNSIGFTIFSPPFSSLYIYSDSISDMGNSANDDEFFEHFKFLIPELLRVTIPGRLCAVHCKDLPMYRGRDGAAGLRDFPGQILRAFEECGWTYHSRVTIWKDPVTEMQRTKNHGLLHKQLCKDSAASRQGMPDYLIVFRKWTEEADFPDPVHGPHDQVRFEGGSYIGEEGPQGVKSERDYSIQVWQRYASPVWFDINQMETLNYRQAKDSKDEQHICPLQLGVIRRAIHLWTNKGDTVFSPFAGIGSEGYEALLLGRKFIGVELKDSYFKTAVKNLEIANSKVTQQRLI